MWEATPSPNSHYSTAKLAQKIGPGGRKCNRRGLARQLNYACVGAAQQALVAHAPLSQPQPVASHLPQVQSVHPQSTHWQEPAEQQVQSVQEQPPPQQAHPPAAQHPPLLAHFSCATPNPPNANAATATDNNLNMENLLKGSPHERTRKTP